MTCNKIRVANNQRGALGNNWKNGRSNLRKYLQKIIVDWKKKSMANYNYKCVVTGKSFEVIHHLYSFNKIISEALSELGLEHYVFIGEYSQDEIQPIADKVIEIHSRYPLGVPLIKNVHNRFHSLYGKLDNTPSQFYDFIDKIKSGEIII